MSEDVGGREQPKNESFDEILNHFGDKAAEILQPLRDYRGDITILGDTIPNVALAIENAFRNSDFILIYQNLKNAEKALADMQYPEQMDFGKAVDSLNNLLPPFLHALVEDVAANDKDVKEEADSVRRLIRHQLNSRVPKSQITREMLDTIPKIIDEIEEEHGEAHEEDAWREERKKRNERLKEEHDRYQERMQNMKTPLGRIWQMIKDTMDRHDEIVGRKMDRHKEEVEQEKVKYLMEQLSNQLTALKDERIKMIKEILDVDEETAKALADKLLEEEAKGRMDDLD